MVASRWRLLLHGAGTGAWNMAADEAILLHADRSAMPPTLRLYSWSPPCVSVGRFQKVDGNVDTEACAALGFHLVRRPTGGRAILHHHEVTYGIVAPLGGAGILESYRELSTGLLRAVELLGASASYGSDAAAASGQGASCFAHAARCDLVADGRKIIGSAQVRTQRHLLQQGSIPLRVDLELNAKVFGWRSTLDAGAAGSLADVLGRVVSADEVVEAVVRGFRESMGLQMEPGVLEAEEEQLARELLERKYGTDAWTLRGEAPQHA